MTLPAFACPFLVGCVILVGAGCAEDACESATPAFEVELVLPRGDALGSLKRVRLDIDAADLHKAADLEVSGELDDGRTSFAAYLGEGGRDGFEARVRVRGFGADGALVLQRSETYAGSGNACNFFRMSVDRTCRIAGGEHLEGFPSPENGCERCEPAVNGGGWTPYRGCVTTVAGTGVDGGADGPAEEAQFSFPVAIAVDSNGELYVTDMGSHRVRRIANGRVETIAGDGLQGHQDGPAKQARFKWPVGVALGQGGAIFVVDSGNCVIRKIVGGTVSTYAGKPGVCALKDGDPTEATFGGPSDLAVAGDGRIYVSDGFPGSIRVIGVDGTVETLVIGELLAISGFSPYGVALAADGGLYFSDTKTSRVFLRTSAGNISVVAGTGERGMLDGDAATARLNQPGGLAVRPGGGIYVADTTNNQVRAIEGGRVTTLAGSGTWGADDGPSDLATFGYPWGLAVDAQGRVFLADTNTHRIRMIVP